jgi:RNA recognition motif-containing protein
VETNIYVGNLPWKTDDAELRRIFEVYGTVSEAKVITDRETGKSRGFGFVKMNDADEAKEAIGCMNGFELGGRPLTVNEAKPREGRSGGGGRGAGRGDDRRRRRDRHSDY